MTYSTVSWKALLVSAVLTLPGLAFAAEPAMTKDGMLVDHKGMTLYTFDKDAKDTSNCYDDCARKWPPLTAAADAAADGEYTQVARKDGSKQWAYDGKPLYLWQNDKKPGDVTGDGVGGVWHVAKE